MPELYTWQEPSAAELESALATYGVAADGSDTGTGKTFKVLEVARRRGVSLVVLCPKSMIADWQAVAALFGVPCQAVNYERVRLGTTVHGKWQVKGRVFQWTLPADTWLVCDEAHRLGGQATQLSALLVAAKRQRIPLLLLSATLLVNPLKGYAIGYALDLHRLTNFGAWARSQGVVDGFYGPEWRPDKLEPARTQEEIMTAIRVAMGPRFTRICKADVPGFPQNQIIPTFVSTREMPELESDYGVEARREIELLKVEGLVEKARDLIEGGFAVALFVNFLGTFEKLREAFPDAAWVRGGQTAARRADEINRFQQNATDTIILMSQAGGTGVSLHDLNGKPRAALVCPSHDAVEFLQVLGRIHRAGSLSPAVNYVVFASGVPVERRIRRQLELKLNSLSALNDADLSDYAHADPGPSPRAVDGAAQNAVPAHTDHPPADSSGRTGTPGVAHLGALHRGDNPDRGGAGSRDRDPSLTLPNMSNKPAIDIVATPVPAPAGQHGERKHARCSPSKLKNLEICPSYEPDNDSPVHPVTLRGTAMHEALETGNDSALLSDNDNEEKRLVEMCREFQAAEAVPGEEVILEPHLKTHDRDVQGFADRLVLEPIQRAVGRDNDEIFVRRARLRDYKMGWNAVDSPDVNPQAVAYTVAVFLAYDEVTEVDFAFLIPRLDLILQHTFKREELPALKLRLSVIAERVRKLAGQEFNLVESNCLYCGAKATCPAMRAKMLPIYNGVTTAERLPMPASMDIATVTEPQDIAYLLNLAHMAEAWAAKVKSYGLTTRLELGQEIPGYDLIERKAKREIVNPLAAFEVAQEFGVTQSEFIAASKMSITSLEASVKDKAPHGEKEAKADAFTDRLTDAGALSRGASFHVLQRSRKKAKPALIAA